MQDMKQIISSHNKTILESTKIKEKQGKTCNCRDKKSFPLKGQCLQKRVVYEANAEHKSCKKQDTNIGITENEFKTKYNQYTSSFRLNHNPPPPKKKKKNKKQKSTTKKTKINNKKNKKQNSHNFK